MPAIIKDISKWSRIFIDTSIIINLFHAQNPEHEDSTAIFVSKLIKLLGSTRDGENKERTFYISSVSITEILCRENDSEKIKKIMRALDGGNVEFLSFDVGSALLFNHHLYPHLSAATLNRYALEFGFKQHELMMAREWITRDYMLIINALENNSDILLTLDRKTFYPLSQTANAPCVLALDELFETSEQYVLKYHNANVESVVNRLNQEATDKKRSKRTESTGNKAPEFGIDQANATTSTNENEKEEGKG